jgi:hypothetical protein
LAKDLVKEIISRRLPNEQAAEPQSRTMTSTPKGVENRWSGQVGTRTKDLFERIDQGQGSWDLAYHLEDVNEMVTTLQPRGNPATYDNVDTIMGEPAMKEALGKFMNRNYDGEIFDFVSAVQDFKAADCDANKMNLAEAMVATTVPESNIGHALKDQIRDTMVELRDEMAASPDRQSLSDESSRKLDGIFDAANAIMRGERGQGGRADLVDGINQKVAQFAASPEFAAGLESIKGEISDGPVRLAAAVSDGLVRLAAESKMENYTTGGQLEVDVAAKLPEALEAATELTKSRATFEQFLEIPGMHTAVESFCKGEYTFENLAFLDVTKEFESTVEGLSIGDDTAQNRNSLDETLAQARSIIDEFVRAEAAQPANLPSGARDYASREATIKRFEGIATRMGEFDGSEDPIELAEEIKRDLFHLFTRPEGSNGSDPRTVAIDFMRLNIMPRFVESDEFKVVVENNLRNELASTFRDSLGV